MSLASEPLAVSMIATLSIGCARWRVARAQGKTLDGGWLFPGLNPVEPLTARQLNRAVQEAALTARIDKRVSLRRNERRKAAFQISANQNCDGTFSEPHFRRIGTDIGH